jgi:hypothetical protein
MGWQARTGDTVLVKSREMTGRTQTLPWWLREEGVKTTEKNILHWPHCPLPFPQTHQRFFPYSTVVNNL